MRRYDSNDRILRQIGPDYRAPVIVPSDTFQFFEGQTRSNLGKEGIVRYEHVVRANIPRSGLFVPDKLR
jgi:hypothetical protein